MKPTDNQPIIVSVPETTVSRYLEASEDVEQMLGASPGPEFLMSLAVEHEDASELVDLYCGEGNRRHNRNVEEDAEIDGAEAAQEGGRHAGIAQLVEINVGQRARPAPQLGVEEHGHHTGDEKGPPQSIQTHPRSAPCP